MDNFYGNNQRHNKGRLHPKSTNGPGFYHAPTYTRTFNSRHQDENPFTSSSRNSALLWHESNKQIPKSARSKGKYCSIALAVATFFVLIAVLAIAGLAFYMGALRTESASPLITFLCRVKVARGDRFIVGLTDKARKYKMQLETLYQRSNLGPALVSCSVDKFGNDTRTFYFRISLNRRKVPKSVHSIEKSLKDILLSDSSNRKPVFANVFFDPRNIYIRRVDSSADLYQRTLPKSNSKESFSRRPPLSSSTSHGSNNHSVLQKSTPSTLSGGVKKLYSNETKEPASSVIQGTFKISKTDADITENRSELSAESPELVLTRTQPVLNTKLKETYVTSAFFKLASGEKGTTPITTPMSTVTVTTKATTEPVTSTSTTAKSTTAPYVPLLASSTTGIYNQEPWVPIYHHLPSEETTEVTFTKSKKNNRAEPIYTSFTNQRLSWIYSDPESVTSKHFQGHPLPVNKLPDVTRVPIESIHLTTPETVIADDVNATVPNLDNKNLDDNTNEEFENVTSSVENNYSSSTFPPDFRVSTEHTNVGLVEVVDVDEAALLLQTTKLPLFTLLPVKSNSGVGRPVRPRPKKPHENGTSTENRSFPSNPADNNRLLLPDGIKYVETEVVTSVSLEQSRVKANKSQLDDFKIMSVLNFAAEVETSGEKNPHELTPDKIKELSKISKLNGNDTSGDVMSTKAVASSNGFNLLTKTFNKIPNYAMDTSSLHNNWSLELANSSIVCNEQSIKCGDGQCLPNSTRCNNLVDCNDGSDEKDCNCADYLRSQFLVKKICDGIVDCWDFSDENRCDWCVPGQYVCSNSKVCINKTLICNGITDCPHGDDERQCVTVAPDLPSAEGFTYNSEGFLMVRKKGNWGKLCAQNFSSPQRKSRVTWEVTDLGQAVCKAMTYGHLDSANVIKENLFNNLYQQTPYYELAYSTGNNNNKSSLTFEATTCDNKEVVVVKCGSLECGARPQVSVRNNARIVGGGNADLGAWPWQAALYKEGEFQCGGTLISDRWLISAGHCFYHSQKEHWVARLGNLRRGTSLPSPYEQLRTLVKIALHPGYVDAGFINDITLLKMQVPVVFSDYVRPICLPPIGVAPKDGKICTVVGWGQLFEIGRIFPDTLQEVQVPIISTAECRKRTLFLPLYQVTDDMFCAGYERGGRDACLGDSGGPLMCSEDDGRWVLQGITSNGYGCARAYRPGVYTKVSHYINWIHEHILNNSDSDTVNSTVVQCSGHRCPLGECLPRSGICNGFIECNDGSDESDCFNVSRTPS